MARLARLVIPDLPHHVAQCGDGLTRAFFDDADYALYRSLLAEHCAAALVYVAFNPVRARLVERALDWPWSSLHAHLGLVEDDRITTTAPVMERFPDLASRIAAGEDEAMSARLRRAEQIGRPVGSNAFIASLERQSGRRLAPAKPGPKPNGDTPKGRINALSP